MTAGEVSERLAAVRSRMADAGGDVGSIRIVAVTKGFGHEAVNAAIDAGLADVGENYASELMAKHDVVTAAGRQCRWHFLGHVQRNKVRSLAPMVHLWHGVDRIAAGTQIATMAGSAGVLVQVNVSGEGHRNGCSFDEAPALVDALVALDLQVRGLMAVAPAGPPEGARPGFRRLARLAARLALPELSMGMSDDLEVAVQEGTTMVRLGRALFGERPAAGRTRR